VSVAGVGFGVLDWTAVIAEKALWTWRAICESEVKWEPWLEEDIDYYYFPASGSFRVDACSMSQNVLVHGEHHRDKLDARL